MKVIVYFSHDRHREDIVKVYKYSDENLALVEKAMRDRWINEDGEGGYEGYFGDLPSDGGYQYGYNEMYYDSFTIVEVKD